MDSIDALAWMRSHIRELIHGENFSWWMVEPGVIRASCQHEGCECVNDETFTEDQFLAMSDFRLPTTDPAFAAKG